MPRAPTWIRARPVAHRGLHDAAAPENSLAAFAAGMAHGYPLELDVHMLRDGTVVVFHDRELGRMTGTPGSLLERSWDEIRGLRLGASDQPIPTLASVLELVDGRVPLLVELKNTGAVGAPEAALWQVLGRYRGDYAVQSFNPLSLAWFRKHAPHVIRGQLATDFRGSDLAFYKRVLLRRLALAPLVSPDFIAYELRCLPYWIPSALRRLGLPLLAWTIRSVDDHARATAVADNFIFEGIRP